MKIKNSFNMELAKKAMNPKIMLEFNYNRKAHEILSDNIENSKLLSPEQISELICKISAALQVAHIRGYESGKRYAKNKILSVINEKI